MGLCELPKVIQRICDQGRRTLCSFFPNLVVELYRHLTYVFLRYLLQKLNPQIPLLDVGPLLSDNSLINDMLLKRWRLYFNDMFLQIFLFSIVLFFLLYVLINFALNMRYSICLKLSLTLKIVFYL